jgi:indolepyruvate ferredoxin oxidoreductase beta subunit
MGKAEYPSDEEILKSIRLFTNKIIQFDAMKLAIEAGSSRSLNMVMLGAIIGTGLSPITKKAAWDAVRNAFPKKFEPINIAAAEKGASKVKEQ